MELHLKIIGIILISLACVHTIFPTYFKWKQELSTLSLINRQMMQVHTFFIAFAILLMGLLCLLCSNELTRSHLGKIICLGMGLFWFARLIIQFVGYSSILWKGKRFETFVHILFSALWIYFSGVFLFIYCN